MHGCLLSPTLFNLYVLHVLHGSWSASILLGLGISLWKLFLANGVVLPGATARGGKQAFKVTCLFVCYWVVLVAEFCQNSANQFGH